MHRHLQFNKLGRVLSDKFDDELHFIKTWVGNPKTTGAIVPTGSRLAKSMASLIRPESGLPVLELGPGTGAITQAILATGIPANQLYSVEYSHEFMKKLHIAYPGVHFIHGDAFDLDRALAGVNLDQFDTVISALPLLNFPQASRIRLVESLLDRLPVGRPVVQFSYGAMSPIIANRGSYSVRHYDWIVRNVPPARVWLYQRTAPQ